MKRNIHLLAAFIILLASCRTTGVGTAKRDNGKLTAVFVQVNDVYEIAPLAGGKSGGMARVATLKKQQLQKNPNTFLVMAGDFVSPSVYNSITELVIGGTYANRRMPIRGKQMIECMNAAGFDFAIFGNHEFDISEAELQSRINESSFQWISSNAFHLQGGNVVPFAKQGTQLSAFPSVHILSLRDDDGTTARIGLLGLVLPFNKAEYVHYTDVLTTAKELYFGLKDSVDGVIAITHQSVGEDKMLAQELPNLLAIIGGHE
ncbi:MAG TPA: metallophosphoesterase, partial [Chitinophagaceae bacterium]|nr:metallophosphoesterase [Chitinophagaceae bacterium]